MIYKNVILQENILFDYSEQERHTPFVLKYDKLFSNLDLSRVQRYQYGRGCKGFDQHAMIKAMILHNLEGFRSIPQLISILKSMPFLTRWIIGFPGDVPDASTFYRFINQFDPEVIRELIAVANKSFYGNAKPSVVAIDSKPVKANTSENNPKKFKRNLSRKDIPPKRNPEAALGYFSSSNDTYTDKKQIVFFWGYRIHLIVDAERDRVLSFRLEPGNKKDEKVALPLFVNLLTQHPEFYRSGIALTADKGYDSSDVFKSWHLLYQGKCFIPKNLRNAKAKELKHPVCQFGRKMRFSGSWEDTTQNRFRVKFDCPRKKKPCPFRETKYGCTVYFQTLQPRPGEVSQFSKGYRNIYPLRQSVERVNAFLQSVDLETPKMFGKNAIENMIGFALLGKTLDFDR